MTEPTPVDQPPQTISPETATVELAGITLTRSSSSRRITDWMGSLEGVKVMLTLLLAEGDDGKPEGIVYSVSARCGDARVAAFGDSVRQALDHLRVHGEDLVEDARRCCATVSVLTDGTGR